MAKIILTLPASLRAGDTTAWSFSHPDYPASQGWSISWRLINSAGKIDIPSVADGDLHGVSVLASDSADWVPGKYDWVAQAEKDLERWTIAVGRIEILPDLAAQVAGYDTRSTARKMLDSVEAVLSNRATRADTEYEISGRKIKFIPHADLLVVRDKLKCEVAGEERAARLAEGLPAGNRVLVRFG